MSAKRPPLSLKAEAFAAHAIAQPDPVKVATEQAALPPRLPVPKTATLIEGKGAKHTKPPAKAGQASREGKVQVVAWVPEGRRAELKIVAAKLRRTVDDLLTSMIDDLVTKHLGN